MSSTIELRLAQYATHTPILIELKAQRDATVRQLRAQISAVMQADEHCLMRVFGRLFVEMPCGGAKRLFVIEDEGESLLGLGVEDGDVLYLEGPLTASSEGVGMAVAMLSEKVEQQEAEQIKRLQEENKASRRMMQQLSDNMDALRAELSLQSAADLQALRGEISKQHREKVEQQSAEVAAQMKELQEEGTAHRQLVQRLSDEIRELTEKNQRTEANLKTHVDNQQALALQEQQRLVETLKTDLAEKAKQQEAEHALQTQQLQEENKASRRMMQQLSDNILALRGEISKQQRLVETLKADLDTTIAVKVKQQEAERVLQTQQLREENKASRRMMQQLSDNMDALRIQLSRQAAADLQALRGEISKQQRLVETLKAEFSEKVKQQEAMQTKQLQEESKKNMDALRIQHLQEESAVQRQIQRLSDGIRALTQQNQCTEATLSIHMAKTDPRVLAMQEQQAQQYMLGMQNVNCADSSGRTPLHHATQDGNVSAMQFLITKGADAMAIDKQKDTPLHSAAFRGHVAAMELLLDEGADVRAADNFGSTPLHYAAFGGHVSAIQMLLLFGADVKATCTRLGRSYTPLQFYNGNDPRVISLLTPK